jgi:hypothetical protein
MAFLGSGAVDRFWPLAHMSRRRFRPRRRLREEARRPFPIPACGRQSSAPRPAFVPDSARNAPPHRDGLRRVALALRNRARAASARALFRPRRDGSCRLLWPRRRFHEADDRRPAGPGRAGPGRAARPSPPQTQANVRFAAEEPMAAGGCGRHCFRRRRRPSGLNARLAGERRQVATLSINDLSISNTRQ